jgi:putative phosphoesterase
MRIALITDIHANLPALEAVAKDVRKHSYDMLVFLGDLVVNGLYPAECFELLESMNPDICIQGNTDGFFSELAPPWKPADERQQYLHTLMEFAKSRLDGEALETISFWPVYAKHPDLPIGFCHGSPFAYDEMMQESDSSQQLREGIEELGLSHLFFGHTHKRTSFKIGETDCINVGALGYRFDGDVRATYGLFDTDESQIHYVDVEYDRQGYLDDLHRLHPPFEENISEIIRTGTIPN